MLDSSLVAPQPKRPDWRWEVCVDFATVLEASLRVVQAQKGIVRHAIQPHAPPAGRGGPMTCPFQETGTDLLVGPLAPHRQVVHVEGIVFRDLRPHDWFS